MEINKKGNRSIQKKKGQTRNNYFGHVKIRNAGKNQIRIKKN